MMNCKQATEIASNTLDRKLGLMEGLSLRMHIWMCGRCRSFLKQLKFIRRTSNKIHEHIETQTELTLTDEAKCKIKDTLNNHQIKS